MIFRCFQYSWLALWNCAESLHNEDFWCSKCSSKTRHFLSERCFRCLNSYDIFNIFHRRNFPMDAAQTPSGNPQRTLSPGRKDWSMKERMWSRDIQSQSCGFQHTCYRHLPKDTRLGDSLARCYLEQFRSPDHLRLDMSWQVELVWQSKQSRRDQRLRVL